MIRAVSKRTPGRRIRIRRPLAWYPPPGTLPNLAGLVVHRAQSEASRIARRHDSDARRAVAHYTVISGAERLRARRARDGYGCGIERRRGGSRRSRDRNRKLIAALAIAAAVGSQVVVNQAAIGCTRNAGRCSAAQLGQRGITLGRISAVIAYFADNDGVLGSSRGRIVGSHTGAHQVRNRDSCDDQDDGNNNEQFDKRETPTVLSLHLFPESL